MRFCALAAFLLLASPPGVLAQGRLTETDSTEIFAVIENWERAWALRDPELASRDYTDDADWTNAFGMRRIGRESIHDLLVDVFELPFVMAGDTDYEYHDLRALSNEVVLVRSRAIRTGQQRPDGTVEEPRRTNHLRVFVRSEDRWAISSHLIGDERTPGEPR